MLPEVVLKQAQEEMLDWHGSGMSVMEMSHRGKEFVSIAEKAEADVRELMDIPDHYRVLFLQGGATSQFAMIPLNLLNGAKKACYVNTGSWSKGAIVEAKKFAEVSIVASSEVQNFTTIPSQESWNIDQEAAYLHYTTNETIGGVEFQEIPDSKGLTLVADMSSNILSRPVDVNQFGLIYAGAQKNMGPAGITLVIVREELLGHVAPNTPSMLDYARHAKAGSMVNTPPTYSWYLMGLVFDWIKRQGGLAEMEVHNRRKANKLYGQIDGSGFYSSPVDPAYRSRMNVPFILADEQLNDAFLQGAANEGLVTLKGHRSVGGMRASIYNAMPEEGVDALVSFMQEFERLNG
jgi:phosphoserine aminotransferase